MACVQLEMKPWMKKKSISRHGIGVTSDVITPSKVKNSHLRCGFTVMTKEFNMLAE